MSVAFAGILLRHITVVSSLMIILDAVTWSAEVKLAFRGVPLTLIRVTVKGFRFNMFGGVELAEYKVA